MNTKLTTSIFKALTFRFPQAASFDCNNCKKQTQNPECQACHRMVSYFNIFQIPEKYNIDESAIHDKARTLQKEYHPDKNNSNQEKDKFGQYSAYINTAKTTLLDDLKRAEYMMSLKGINVDEESIIEDNKFMMDMFELQEEIEETSQVKELMEIQYRIENVMQEMKQHLEEFFKSDDMPKCREFIYKYKYFHRALSNIKVKLEDMGK